MEKSRLHKGDINCFSSLAAARLCMSPTGRHRRSQQAPCATYACSADLTDDATSPAPSLSLALQSHVCVTVPCMHTVSVHQRSNLSALGAVEILRARTCAMIGNACTVAIAARKKSSSERLCMFQDLMPTCGGKKDPYVCIIPSFVKVLLCYRVCTSSHADDTGGAGHLSLQSNGRLSVRVQFLACFRTSF